MSDSYLLCSSLKRGSFIRGAARLEVSRYFIAFLASNFCTVLPKNNQLKCPINSTFSSKKASCIPHSCWDKFSYRDQLFRLFFVIVVGIFVVLYAMYRAVSFAVCAVWRFLSLRAKCE